MRIKPRLFIVAIVAQTSSLLTKVFPDNGINGHPIIRPVISSFIGFCIATSSSRNMEDPIFLFYYKCILCISLCSLANAFTLKDEQNLHTTLLSGYNSNLHPGMNRSVPLKVSISFHLSYLKEFQEYSGKFSVNGFFIMNWLDDRLKWDPNSYDELLDTRFPQDILWIPNLVNSNPFEKIFGLGSKLISVEVSSSGNCKWIPYQSFNVICDVDVTKYPFDTQQCAINFFLWGYKDKEVDIQFTSSIVGFNHYKHHGIWDVFKSETQKRLSPDGYSEIIIKLWLKRRNAYYISNLIIPMFSISLLMGFAFLLPPVSGERVGFITTVSLSYIVFLTIVLGKLPESSEPSSAIICYILMIFVMNGSISTALVIVGLRMHEAPRDKPVPNLLKKIVSFNYRSSKIEISSEVAPSNTKTNGFNEAVEENISWADIAKLFDKLCLIFSTIECVLLIIVYFCLVL